MCRLNQPPLLRGSKMVFASFDSLKLKRSTRNIHAMIDITNLKLCLTIKKVNSYEMSIIILMLSHVLLLSGKLVGQLLSPHSSSKLIKANFLIANVTYFFNAQSDIKPVYFFCFPNTICMPFLRNWKTGSDSPK